MFKKIITSSLTFILMGVFSLTAQAAVPNFLTGLTSAGNISVSEGRGLFGLNSDGVVGHGTLYINSGGPDFGGSPLGNVYIASPINSDNGGGNVYLSGAGTGGSGNVFVGSLNTDGLPVGNLFVYGNVGIGTTSPAAKLEVVDASNSWSIMAGGRRISHVDLPQYSDDAATRGYVDANFLTLTGAISTSSLWSGTKNGNIWNGDAGLGKVGIGTTNPGYKLDVQGGEARISSKLWLDSAEGLSVYGIRGRNSNEQIEMYNRVSIGSPGGWTVFPQAPVFGLSTYGGANFATNQGNVGIGTTNPGAKLDVSGVIRVTNFNPDNSLVYSYLKTNYAQNNAFELGVNGHKLITTMDDYWNGGTLQLWTSDAPKMTILSSGKVGIGTTLPNVALEVNGIIRAGVINGISLGGDAGRLRFSGYASGPVIRVLDTADNYGTFGVKTLSVGGSYAGIAAPTSGMIIEGSVGIGTTNPGSRMELYGSTDQVTANLTDAGSRLSSLALNSPNSSYGAGAAITFGNSQSNTAGSLGMAAIKGFLTNGSGNTQGDLAFSTRNATTDTNLTERMRILGNGAIGIGTTSPAAKLEVVDASNSWSIMAGGRRISHVDLPQYSDDAATRGYVDTNVGNSANWNAAYTHSINVSGAVHGATSASTGNMIVRRDGSGNFSAGTITATLSGNASTATTATALAANGGNCTTGNYPLGVDASGNVESCTAVPTDTDIYWTGTPTNLNAATARNSLGLGALALQSTVTDAQVPDDITINNATNAGTVGGVDISKIIYGGNVSGSNSMSATQNVYELPQYKSGFWDLNGASWTPTTGWYWGATFAHTSNSGIYNYSGQLIFTNDSGGNGVYARTISAGTPTVWSRMLSDTSNVNSSGNLQITGSGPHYISNGNVGIGIINPTYKLQIIGGVSTDAANTITNSNLEVGTGDYGVYIRQMGEANGIGGAHWANQIIGKDGNTLEIYTFGGQSLVFGVNSTEKMRIASNGSVGIGTTTPSSAYKLDVSGTIAAVSFNYNSDRSLKKNIATIKDPLNKILNLRGVTFNWKKDNTPGVGLIAQEVETVFPELVTEGNGIKSVQYGNLVAPLIEAVKAQQKEINNLEARINILEKKK